MTASQQRVRTARRPRITRLVRIFSKERPGKGQERPRQDKVSHTFRARLGDESSKDPGEDGLAPGGCLQGLNQDQYEKAGQDRPKVASDKTRVLPQSPLVLALPAIPPSKIRLRPLLAG